MMNKNLVKCLGKGISFHENTMINFNGSGLVLGVSLNIEKHIADYLPANNVKKGNHMFVYHLETQIQSENVNVFNVQSIHDKLLNRCKSHIRMAKSNYYKREALKYQNLSKNEV